MAESSHFLLDISGSTRIGNTNAVEFDISMGLRLNGTDKSVYATLKTEDPRGVSLPALLKALAPGDKTEIPGFLNQLPAIRALSVSYGTGEHSSEFSITFETRLTINGKDIDATLQAAYKKIEGADSAFTFGGVLRIGNHRFGLSYQKTEDNWYMYAAYLHSGITTINLRDIAGSVFSNPNAIPDATLTLNDFKAFLLYRKAVDGNTALLVGLGAGLHLNLEDLPLAGSLFAKDDAFAFQEVLALYASGTFTQSELQRYAGMPAVSITAGFNVSAQLLINGHEEYYVLNDGPGKTYLPPGEGNNTGDTAEVSTLPGEVASKAKWTRVDKQIGPVNLQRIGFTYNEGRVVLLLDASMQMAGIGMQMISLGLGFKLEWKFPPALPEFYIDGIGLSYTKDPIRISGMFLRATPIEGVEQYSYYGSAQLSLAKFSVSGIGAYSKLIEPKPDGAVSLFIYAMYAGAIGGPAFFFVTGIAAGFGYNRRVKVPAIREVNTFPLVAMALNPNPAKTLNDILAELVSKQWIPASPGDYWLAVGIKFTSFKLIESFVLVMAQFGTRTEFAILGLSILAWPSKDKAIAYVELAVRASFGPDSDVIAVEAMLTSNSYVLDKNCKLTGGFAFYAWVKGPHAGDFVITLGGYHPKFNKPSHYPDVDRLGLNWRISNELQIKGGLYYALTPNAIMAGGRLEVTFSLSFLTASVTLWADMLIAWAPFQYAIDMGIRVKIDAYIDMGLFTVHFKLEMGAELHIWGPPFAGEAFVDWSVFSFTIPFGSAAKKKPEKLDWPAFKQQFIPTNTNKRITPEIIISAGIINEYTIHTGTGEIKYLLVNPHQLKINVDVPVPVTTVRVPDQSGALTEIAADSNMQTDNGLLKYADRNRTLGIRPMQETTLASTLSVKVMMNGQSLSGNFAPQYSTYTAGVPGSLWSHDQGSGNNNNPEEVKILANALKGVAIAAKEAPAPIDPPGFDLNGKFRTVDESLQWSYIAALTGPDNTAYSDPIKTIMNNKLDDAAIAATRQAIIAAALQAQEATGATVTTGRLHGWVAALSAEPVIVQVGGLPQYKNETGKNS
ncbi:DUF6603 domain-containing protein [Chitinophaga ginsengisoli]|uniref:DUF6603 domain-containing protein n=1 Tax=Chitinophaga ginsengisoli TaxID=363837 RepID=A0A2P8GLS0_9BACT|nr:DUF6603 domain-containing protein [Chitinophaga ginsengisoli]PSL34906.1 hypothetical protein CLV42_102480 [Chitinophaga ginsengisoli]